MPKRNIAEIGVFVISAAVCIFAVGCSFIAKDGRADQPTDQNALFSPPQLVGHIRSDDLSETSGLAASKCQRNVFWAHNDSGDDAILFAISEEGETQGVFQVEGAANIDWEDIAEIKDVDGNCRLYIGDIGNNDLERDKLTIYTVEEPRIDENARATSRRVPGKIKLENRIDYSYPDGHKYNAEALMVEPKGGAIYVVTKSTDSPARVFKLNRAADQRNTQVAEEMGEIRLPAVPNGMVTGGDIAPDGLSLVLCDYFDGYELVLPDKAKTFDDIWRAKPRVFDIGNREIGEAVAFTADGKAVISTSENKHPPIYRTVRRMIDR